ncbi:MAG: hypothetical protein HRU25_13340, partial [Psychrobium sp.]|nr:hypothetical protein [Psychrobium sp.]
MKYTLIKIITLSSLFYGLSALSTDAVANNTLVNEAVMNGNAQQVNEISAVKTPTDEHHHDHAQEKASKAKAKDDGHGHNENLKNTDTKQSEGGHEEGISF